MKMYHYRATMSVLLVYGEVVEFVVNSDTKCLRCAISAP